MIFHTGLRRCPQPVCLRFGEKSGRIGKQNGEKNEESGFPLTVI